MLFVTQQLQLLWNGSTVKCLFSDLVNLVPESLQSDSPPEYRSQGASYKGGSSKDMAASVQSL